WSGSISFDSFLPSVLLWLVVIVAVVGVDVMVAVIVAVVVVVVEKAVTFPSMLRGNPPMKASRSFSVFGTMFGHKTANSWNLLTLSDPIGLIYPDRLDVCIPPGHGIISQGVLVGLVFLLGLLVLAIVAACTSRAAKLWYDDEDGDNNEDGDNDEWIGIMKQQEVDNESTMAFELLKFIKSLKEEQ
ncbi:hypothetical protein Tco_1026440, partial [Tanacetum coccineum]